MIKTILSSAAILVTFTSAAHAGPFTNISSVSTPYGQFGCLQRAQNKLFSLFATGINTNNSGVWGNVGESTIGVWCRGPEAIIVVSGGEVRSLREEMKNAF